LRSDRALVSLAATLPEPLTLVDVGVRWGFEKRWTQLAPAARLVGFDADAQECAALAQRHRDLPDATFAAVALSDREGEATLHIAAEPASSSLLEPDRDVIARRRGMETMRAVRHTAIETTTLQRWAAAAGHTRVDVLKLDVQGAELAVLRGAGDLLESVRTLDLEVEFNPIYRDQPLFADVDTFLRARGFALWGLEELTRYRLENGPGGQLVWGRARYVRRSVSDPPAAQPWQENVRDACAAWALELDDVALAAIRRAAATHAPAVPVRAQLERAATWRARRDSLRERDWHGAAGRYVRVAALATRGYDDERIARELRLTVENVRLLRGAVPWLR
jgi:FkbM family methyltransferase